MPKHFEAWITTKDADGNTAVEPLEYETTHDVDVKRAARTIRLHLKNAAAPAYGKGRDVADPDLARRFD